MRIGTKLLLGFIPLAILTAMVAEVLYINSKWISESSQRVMDVYHNYSNVLEMRKNEQNFLFYREKFYLSRLKDLHGQSDAFFSREKELGKGDPQVVEEFTRARKILGEYRSLADQLQASRPGPQAEEKISEMAALGHQLERMSEQMIHLAWIPIQMGTRKARMYSIAFAVQAALIGAVLAFYLSQLLVKPIQQLVRATKRVAEGDFSQPVKIRSRDEIRELAESFNGMVASLQRGQARLEQSGQELRETKGTLENIVQSSVDAIVATDSKGRITFANRSMGEVLSGAGETEEQVVGVAMAQLYSGGIAEARKIMAILREKGRLLNYETTMLWKEREIPILTSASLLKDEHGTVVGTLGVIKNLTEKKKLEEELKKAQSELVQKEKLAAIGRLASGVAHEMNDPLTSILTFSNLLREETEEGDPNRESLDIIIKEAARARQIISDLLSFSRQHKPALEWIDLNDALNISLLMLEKQGTLENIDVQMRLARELPLIRADAGQMQQVFTNILLNAVQSMAGTPVEAGAGKLFLETRFCEEAHEEPSFSGALKTPFIRVMIRDNGKGVHSEDMSKIFDPFFTTKRTGEGTGLGLYIVSGILKNHGAQYRLDSREGQGTTFTIDFPLYESGKA